MSDTFDSKFGQVVAVPFQHSDATTQETDNDMTLLIDTLWTAPFAGSVVGITARANAAITAGTITLKPHKASTEYAETGTPAPVLSSAAQATYATVRPNALTFAAGDTLGISYSTTTTLNPTNSLDMDACLLVQLDPS
jgi:hypothetical protein